MPFDVPRSRAPRSTSARSLVSEGDRDGVRQRVPVPEVEATPAPELGCGSPGPRVAPRANDSYVVVDERDEGVFVLVVAAWPIHDDLGRLDFRGRRVATVSETALEPGGRKRAKRPEGVDRPGMVTRSASAARSGGPRRTWGWIVDVTGEARDQAKIAFHAAVALEGDAARRRGRCGSTSRPRIRLRPWRSRRSRIRPSERWPSLSRSPTASSRRFRRARRSSITSAPTTSVYFLCNVGDGDAQLLLLPEQAATQTGTRMRRRSSSTAPARRRSRGCPVPRRRRAAPGADRKPDSLPTADRVVVATHPHPTTSAASAAPPRGSPGRPRRYRSRATTTRAPTTSR